MKNVLFLFLTALSMFACVPLEPGAYGPYDPTWDASPDYYPPVVYQEPVYYPPPIPVSYPYKYYYYVPNGPYVDIVIIDSYGHKRVHQWHENGRRMRGDRFDDWQRHHKVHKKEYENKKKYGKPETHGQPPNIHSDRFDANGKNKPPKIEKNPYAKPEYQGQQQNMPANTFDTRGKKKPSKIEKNPYAKPEYQGQQQNVPANTFDSTGKKKPFNVDKNQFEKHDNQGYPPTTQKKRIKENKQVQNASDQMNLKPSTNKDPGQMNLKPSTRKEPAPMNLQPSTGKEQGKKRPKKTDDAVEQIK
jgi:hypothetical protein